MALITSPAWILSFSTDEWFRADCVISNLNNVFGVLWNAPLCPSVWLISQLFPFDTSSIVGWRINSDEVQTGIQIRYQSCGFIEWAKLVVLVLMETSRTTNTKHIFVFQWSINFSFPILLLFLSYIFRLLLDILKCYLKKFVKMPFHVRIFWNVWQ